MIQIIPSILTNDPIEAREMIARCEGLVERVSIDVIDGKYAPNKTFDPMVLADLDTELKLDFQLLVVDPINWVEKCIRAQADRIIGHIEYMEDQIEFVGKVQEAGMSVGLGVDIETPVEKLEPAILTNVDVILVMSVPGGFGGQKFDERALNKIKALDEMRMRDISPFKIQDDGGVTLDSIYNVHSVGADEVSIGRIIFEGDDILANIKRFQEAAHRIEK